MSVEEGEHVITDPGGKLARSEVVVANASPVHIIV